MFCPSAVHKKPIFIIDSRQPRARAVISDHWTNCCTAQLINFDIDTVITTLEKVPNIWFLMYFLDVFDLRNTGCLYKLSRIKLFWWLLKCSKSNFNPVHVFLHFKSFCLVVLKVILASKLSELQQFETWAAN